MRRVYKVDLHTEWRARRWAALLDYVDHLPRNSAYVEAISNDEEWAAEVLRSDSLSRKPRQRMADYSPEVERLTDLVDLVRELIAATVAGQGVNPRRPVPAPRPVTAIDRLRKRQREKQHRSLVARLLPQKAIQPAS
ncbi:hypothetical protein [Micromonospora arborensis]|uniref:hypothetical protein n=1 Tax=Micromonospora arborensis TaxID=2116518 RepID=UPI00371E0D43